MTKPCRIVLSPQQAVEIYSRKLELLASQKFGPHVHRSRWLLRGQSARVSERYNVSAKTIRDIWSRRTWTFATGRLWLTESPQSSSQVFLHSTLFVQTNCRQESYSIVLQLLGFHLDNVSNTPRMETVGANHPQSNLRSIAASSSMDDLEQRRLPLSKVEEYTIIERDLASLPDTVVGRPNYDRHFLSILHDGYFLSELTNCHNSTDLASAMARDPFYADWPYWDRAT